MNLLNSEEGTKAFNWIKRVNIIKGVANALSYMQGQRHSWVGGWGGAMAPPIYLLKITSINIGTSFRNFVL